MNLKAQVFGATILPKVGSAEMEPRASRKSARAWRKDAAVLFGASFPLCNLLETHRCNYPSLSLGPGGFEFQGWHSLGSNWGKSNLFFLFVLLKNY